MHANEGWRKTTVGKMNCFTFQQMYKRMQRTKLIIMKHFLLKLVQANYLKLNFIDKIN